MSLTHQNQPAHQDQIITWLRGLLTVAWADGQFHPEEQDLIEAWIQDEALQLDGVQSALDLSPISPADLAKGLGPDPAIAENFLRTAVMVAIANGVYSSEEANVVNKFQQALKIEVGALRALEQTLYRPEAAAASPKLPVPSLPVTPLQPVRHWLDELDIQDPRLARFICKLVPAQCPFERDVTLFGRKVVHIPPMCKLNPLYDQLVGLRFRALSYLADKHQEFLT